MSDHTGTTVTIDDPQMASTNFYWTYETQSQIFNLQTTIRGILSLEQVQAHIKSALEATAHIHSLGGLAKQVGKSAYETPASPLPEPTPVDTILTEMANIPFPTSEPQEPASDTFSTEFLNVEIKDGKKFYKVMGGQYSKYGVTAWGEVLTKAGIPIEKMEGKKYNLPGYKATISVNEKGYKKISMLEKVI